VSRHAGGLLAAFLIFGVLATANTGGYRFGVSDQAYYAVAALATANPALFPKDRSLIDVQSRFTLSDDVFGWLVKTLPVDLPALYFATYVLTLAVLFAAAIVFARRLGLSWWAVAAMLLLLTLRHRIVKTGVNSLEGYTHMRMLAFAFGIAALTGLIRARYLWIAFWLVMSAVAHTTTALWFGLALAAGAAMTRPAWRRAALFALLPTGALAVWALAGGPLAGRLTMMDAAWLDVVLSRDYLFPSGWPAYAWILNLGYPVVILLIYRARRAQGVATDGERALVAGMLALLAVFLLSVPLSALHVALAVQLQVNRVFWLMDFAALVYFAWWLIDGPPARGRRRWRVTALTLIAAFSIGRGVYVLAIETERRLVQISLTPGAWTDAMTWLKQQPAGWHVLADPAHAWKYGVNVRIAGEKDVLLDVTKDPAIATYDRAVAMRVSERLAALADFDRFTTAEIRALASRYHLDVFVADSARSFDFPVLYRNAGIAVYDLR